MGAALARLSSAGRRIRTLNSWTWTASVTSLLLVGPLLVVVFGLSAPRQRSVAAPR